MRPLAPPDEIRHHPPLRRPEKAARRILEIANAFEPVQSRIHIEKINEPFLFRESGTPAEYGAGMKLVIERGWLAMHESGTYVKFTAGRRRAVRLKPPDSLSFCPPNAARASGIDG